MPQVSKERILEFQQIVKERYSRDISFAEAAEIANGLVGYFSLLAETEARERMDKDPAKSKDGN